MIHKPSVERVKTSVDPEGFLGIFQSMIEEAEEEGRDINQVCMSYIEDGDEFVEGTFVPELWLVVRKVLPDEQS
jgi:hypothetical protein